MEKFKESEWYSYDKKYIKDIIRLQKALRVHGKIDASLAECSNLWSIRSSWWAASFMNMPITTKKTYDDVKFVLDACFEMINEAKKQGIEFDLNKAMEICEISSQYGYMDNFFKKYGIVKK